MPRATRFDRQPLSRRLPPPRVAPSATLVPPVPTPINVPVAPPTTAPINASVAPALTAAPSGRFATQPLSRQPPPTVAPPTVAPSTVSPLAPFVPPTGIIGSEQALLAGQQAGIESQLLGAEIGREDIGAGIQQGLSTLGQAGGNIEQTLQPILQGLDPFVSGAQGASQVQAALSGALGPEAQAQAFREFQESPGQQFLQQEQERAVIRGAAATGQGTSGNVLEELQRKAIGRAEQAFQNRFQNLGQVASRGLPAIGQQAASLCVCDACVMRV